MSETMDFRTFVGSLLFGIKFENIALWLVGGFGALFQSKKLVYLVTKAASTSSRRMIEFSGASARRCCSRSSLIDLSERFSTQME